MRELPRTITETARLLRTREVSAVELADAFLDAARADPFNAWLHLAPEHARAQAVAADAALRDGGGGDGASLLTGVPWACKDIIGTKGIVTTAASKILAGYKPAYSATVVERLDSRGTPRSGRFAIRGTRRASPVARPAGRPPPSPQVRRSSRSAPTRAVRSGSPARCRASSG